MEFECVQRKSDNQIIIKWWAWSTSLASAIYSISFESSLWHQYCNTPGRFGWYSDNHSERSRHPIFSRLL